MEESLIEMYLARGGVRHVEGIPLVGKILKAIHAQVIKKTAREKVKAVVEEFRTVKPKEVAKKVEEALERLLLIAIFPVDTGLAFAPTIFSRG